MFVLAVSLVPAWPGNSAEKRSEQRPGISCLIEVRLQERACWGVIIRLEQGRFSPTISPNQINVIDAKYGRDLSDIMEWTVSPDGAQLAIKFKHGLGGFGSCNSVTVRIARPAFKEPPPRFIGSAEWTIDTDIP